MPFSTWSAGSKAESSLAALGLEMDIVRGRRSDEVFD
jgi:hypothetical protein